jgi:hypothetical protein
MSDPTKISRRLPNPLRVSTQAVVEGCLLFRRCQGIDIRRTGRKSLRVTLKRHQVGICWGRVPDVA